MKDMKINDCTAQKRAVRRVFMWMIAFMLLYLPIALFVVALALGYVWSIIWGFYAIFCDDYLKGFVSVVAGGIVGWSLAYPFSKGILRPFYVLYKSDRDVRNEITEDDAPSLVHFIWKIADMAKVPHPAHIYVTPDANACVFFDSRFTNIFLPVKKNLQVGLGIFHHMSLSETAACLAHEFGHFSQETMRWGTVMQILNTFITSTMSVNERWNTTVNHLIDFPWILGGGIFISVAIKGLGWLLYGLTIGYVKAMEFIYDRVQLAYLRLSRQMEYDADAVAARIVGSETYVSFASKLLETSGRTNCFLSTVQDLASKNELITDFWTAYEKTDRYLEEATDIHVSSTTPLSEPFQKITDAQLIFESIYSTHPDWRVRIDAVRNANYPKTADIEGKAWDIVPQNVKDLVARQCLADLKAMCDISKEITLIGNDQIDAVIDEELYWSPYRPYLFQRDVVEFDYNRCTPADTFRPGDKENLATINRYLATKSDYDNALVIRRSPKFSKVIYQGVTYKASDLPINKIKEAYEQSKAAVAQIDESLCRFAMSKVADPDFVKVGYAHVFYAQRFLETYEAVSQQERETIDILNKAQSDNNSHQFNLILQSLRKLNQCLYTDGISHINREMFCQYASQEIIDSINHYISASDSLFTQGTIYRDSVDLLINTCNQIRDVHTGIRDYSKGTLADICLGRCHPEESEAAVAPEEGEAAAE